MVRIDRAAAEEYYVVLARGVQRIGEVTADLIRFTDSQHTGDIDTVAPDDIAAAPILDTLPVSTFPATRGRVQRRRCVRTVAAQPVGRQYRCVDWRFASGRRRELVVAGAGRRRRPQRRHRLHSAGSQPLRPIDRRSPETARAAGALYFIDESGVVFGLRDEDTAKHLGLTGAPVAAPWPVLSRLPRGPELSKDAASIVRDSIAGPS